MELSNLGVTIEWERNYDDAVAHLNSNSPDLVLLDLMLQGINHGPKLAALCDQLSIPYVIMTSHSSLQVYDEMTALRPEAFYSKPIDYLSLKYFLAKYFDDSDGTNLNQVIDGIYVRKKSALRKIHFDDIDYLHGEGNYVTIHANQQKFVIRKSLKQIGLELPERLFIRIHRNFIVKISKIEQVDFNVSSIAISGVSLPLGRSYKKGVKLQITNL